MGIFEGWWRSESQGTGGGEGVRITCDDKGQNHGDIGGLVGI